jgi:hypothetical protein
MDLRNKKKEVFPSAKDAFNFHLVPLEDIKNNCIYLLDANVLLYPFTTNVNSTLTEITKIYKVLTEQNRLFLPAQAVREYLDNRATHLGNINKALSDKSSQSFKCIGNYPLLSDMEGYEDLLKFEKEIDEGIKKYRKQISKTQSAIKSWGWNDPVSKMYQETLSNFILDEDGIDDEEILKDLERRNELKIPPGYKDSGKSDNQAGDLIIWHELLNLAEEKKCDLVFVSGDSKPDWWHQSNGSPLYPRFELVDEFRRKTNGKSFHIINLSKLLELYDAEPDVVEAIKSSENMSHPNTRQSLMTDDQLVDKAINIVSCLRQELSDSRLYSDKLSNERMTAMRSASESDRDIIWNKYNDLDREPTLSLMNMYETKFKVNAIIVMNELLNRLPKEINSRRDKHSFVNYEHPTNPIGLSMVLDDLEFLAKSIP